MLGLELIVLQAVPIVVELKAHSGFSYISSWYIVVMVWQIVRIIKIVE